MPDTSRTRLETIPSPIETVQRVAEQAAYTIVDKERHSHTLAAGFARGGEVAGIQRQMVDPAHRLALSQEMGRFAAIECWH